MKWWKLDRDIPPSRLGRRGIPRPGLHDQPWDHRYGLYLGDNGQRLWWTLDGKVMDTVEIPEHYFSEAAIEESLSRGAYATIMGAAFYNRSIYKVDDVKISVSA